MNHGLDDVIFPCRALPGDIATADPRVPPGANHVEALQASVLHSKKSCNHDNPINHGLDDVRPARIPISGITLPRVQPGGTPY